MCTLTIVRTSEATGGGGPRPVGIRMACNRDEARTRPPALPPEVRDFGPCRAILPIDPVGGGTWIAINDSGLAASLLNHYSAKRRGERTASALEATASRGTIIPRLMHCATMDAALAALEGIDVSAYPPFRLILTDGRDLVEATGDARRLASIRRTLGDAPVMFASSGLGDDVVDGPRRALFHQILTPGPDLADRQDAYHRHSWPDRRQLSVCMSRADARTVSYTVVQREPDRIWLTYYGDAPDRPVTPVRVELASKAAR